jgi:hypothetical protein
MAKRFKVQFDKNSYKPTDEIKFIWGITNETNDMFESIVPLSFFTKDNGYDLNDIDSVTTVAIGFGLDLDQGHQKVVRIDDSVSKPEVKDIFPSISNVKRANDEFPIAFVTKVNLQFVDIGVGGINFLNSAELDNSEGLPVTLEKNINLDRIHFYKSDIESDDNKFMLYARHDNASEMFALSYEDIGEMIAEDSIKPLYVPAKKESNVKLDEFPKNIQHHMTNTLNDGIKFRVVDGMMTALLRKHGVRISLGMESVEDVEEAIEKIMAVMRLSVELQLTNLKYNLRKTPELKIALRDVGCESLVDNVTYFVSEGTNYKIFVDILAVW